MILNMESIMRKINLILLFLLALVPMLAAGPDMVPVVGGWIAVGLGADDQPIQVRVSDFQIARYELTLKEFREFVTATGYLSTAEIKGAGFGLVEAAWTEKAGLSWRDPGYEQADDHPVASLTWYDAVAYCNWLSAESGLTPAYTIDKVNKDPNNQNEVDTERWTVTWNPGADGYRLPTATEWEFAASDRGMGYLYSWGDDDLLENPLLEPPANLADESHLEYYEQFDDFPWGYMEGYEDGYAFSSPVGSFSPNFLGIHDMAGNVSELCWDWHSLDYQSENGSIDPKGPAEGSVHAQRGSAWCDALEESRIGYRRDLSTDYLSYNYIGMRLARNAVR